MPVRVMIEIEEEKLTEVASKFKIGLTIGAKEDTEGEKALAEAVSEVLKSFFRGVSESGAKDADSEVFDKIDNEDLNSIIKGILETGD